MTTFVPAHLGPIQPLPDHQTAIKTVTNCHQLSPTISNRNTLAPRSALTLVTCLLLSQAALTHRSCRVVQIVQNRNPEWRNRAEETAGLFSRLSQTVVPCRFLDGSKTVESPPIEQILRENAIIPPTAYFRLIRHSSVTSSSSYDSVPRCTTNQSVVTFSRI